jgi:hypothetical protein
VFDLSEIMRRLELESVKKRYRELREARQWADGTIEVLAGELLPAPIDVQGAEAWARLTKTLQSAAPRALTTKVNAAVGDVTWGGDGEQPDAKLEALDLRSLARAVVTDLIVGGIAAANAITDVRNRENRITRLTGLIEPITDEFDRDRVTGLYQVCQYLRSGRLEWDVWVYDFEQEERRYWRGLTNPTDLALAPVVTEGIPMPRYQIAGADEDGYPMGELLASVPLFRSLWATEARLARVEELAAYPSLFLKGSVKVDKAGPAIVWRSDDTSADAKWMEPGDMEQLRLQRALKLERIRDDLALPGGFLGNDSPSGEALREANIRFRQSSENLALLASKLLTDAVADYAALESVQPVPVVVTPSNEYARTERITDLINLKKESMLPARVIATELQPYYPTWDDEQLEEWVTAKETEAKQVMEAPREPAAAASNLQ